MIKSNSTISYIFDALFLTMLTFLCTVLNFPAFILGIALIIIAYRRNYINTIVNLGIIFVVLILINALYCKNSVQSSVVMYFREISVPVVIGFSFKKSKSYISTVCSGMFAYLIVLLLDLLKMRFIDNLNITDTLVTLPVNQNFDSFGFAFAELGITANEIINMITMVIPAFMIIVAVIVSLLYVVVGKKIIDWVYPHEKLSIGSFSQIQFSKFFAYLLIIFTIIMLIATKGVFIDALTNVVIIMFFAFFICGISFIDFYFKKTGLWAIVRIIVYIIAFIGLIVLSTFAFGLINPVYIISIIGMCDSISDFRKLRK